jgi:hypothetical protein
MTVATFRVPHRVYSEEDRFHHRRLLYAEGQMIKLEEAVAAGLTQPGAVPEDDLPFTVPMDLFEPAEPVIHTEADGREVAQPRRLVARAGTVITVGKAKELGLVSAEGEAGGASPAKKEEPRGTPPAAPPSPGDGVRTAKVPSPKG